VAHLPENKEEGGVMPNYVLLMKLTEQGAKTIKEAPGRIEAGIKAWEAMGGKMKAFYILMGEYDYAAIGEAPNDEVAATFSLALASLGNVKTETHRAFTMEEFAGMVKKVTIT
jgi:uncharacterized protein with GYD domain